MGAASLQLVPASFSWARDAVGLFSSHHHTFAAAALLYYPTIFGLQRLMRDRHAFDLGGAGTLAAINYIFWWEAGLALFSLLGAWHVLPLAAEPILERGGDVAAAICGAGVHDDPRAWWMLAFMVSKVAEFGDTIFVVLRKKPLIVLQHYHHLATMLYCWYGTLHVYSLNNTNVYFCGMNLFVHSLMYSWYAATRTGWKSPRLLMASVTLLQIVQMAVGLGIVLVAAWGPATKSCGVWPRADPLGLYACLGMYASYLVLFAKLFQENYLKGGRRGRKEGPAGKKSA